MSMTLGRFSTTEDPEAGSLRQSGDEVSFDSMIVGTSTADMQARVQQLRGLVDNPDESVFPFTWSEDSTFDGFYTDVKVEVNDAPAMYAAWNVPFSVRMRRVPGHAAPQFEAICTQVAMTNSHSLPSAVGTGIVAVPYTDLQEASLPRNITTGAVNGAFLAGSTLTVDGGLVRTTNPPDAPCTFRWVWSTPPAYYYEGSARFEQSYSGTYYPLHGPQVRAAANAWRVSNGLVRATVTATHIEVSHHDGSNWDTAKQYTLAGVSGSAPSLQEQPVVRVLRNTPHQVVVRCVLGMEATVSSTVMDISLRRGCRFATFSLTSNYTTDWYIQNSEAGTALTGGFRATSTDAAGNRYVVASPSAQTNTLASGRLKLTTAATSFLFCIGSEVGADGSGQTLINQYIQAISEDHRVVSR